MVNPTCGACTDPNASIDYIDGYPGEYGEYTVTIADYGCDRSEDTASQNLRDLLGLPDDGAASDGTVTLLYRLGSGIRVPKGEAQYSTWKGHRLDCECLKRVCEEGGGTAPTISSTIKCISDFFLDEDGIYDPNPDKVGLATKTILNESFCVGTGIRLDGTITNLMTFDTSIATDDRFNGIPAEGSFTNFVDPYGIIHAAMWTIIGGNQIDITFMTQDPRIPGESEGEGRVVKVGRSLVVYKTGLTTITRQIIKSTSSGLVILGQGSVQEKGEFQATFPCSTQPSDPFLYHLGCGITDAIEFISGSGDTLLSDPEPPVSNEAIWWPYITNDGFQLYGDDLRPLTSLPDGKVYDNDDIVYPPPSVQPPHLPPSPEPPVPPVPPVPSCSPSTLNCDGAPFTPFDLTAKVEISTAESYNSGSYFSGPSMALIDPSTHRLWITARKNNSGIKKAFFYSDDAGATWSSPEYISDSTTVDDRTEIYIGLDGKLVTTVYDDTNSTMEFWRRTGNDITPAWTKISEPSGTYDTYSGQSLVQDPITGYWHYFYRTPAFGTPTQHRDINHIISTDNLATWGSPAVAGNKSFWYLNNFTVLPDNAGNIYFICGGGLGLTASWHITVLKYSSGVWSTFKEFTADGTPSTTYGLHAAFDSSNTLHIIWARNASPNLAYYTVTSGGVGTSMGDPRGVYGSGLPADPQITVSSDDYIHMTYYDTFTTSSYKYIRSCDGGATWTYPSEIFQTAGQLVPTGCRFFYIEEASKRINVGTSILVHASNYGTNKLYYIPALDYCIV